MAQVTMITGGAGYIGSHTVREMRRAGREVLVIDDFSTGHAEAVRKSAAIAADIRDTSRIVQIMKKYRVDSVIHFAAHSQVGESMVHPRKYYDNNVFGTLSILKAMRKCGVDKIVFSSTAAVYGDSEVTPITEDAPKLPTNVYGRTKLMIETMMEDFDMAYGIRAICLRYFNAAGADRKGDIGEAHNPETHLVPRILRTALGEYDYVSIFGTDYPTRDGTCVRDYIHVTDLAQAHLLALEAMERGAPSNRYNLGNGSGYSVREVIDMARRITERDFIVREQPRRAGDPATLIASSEKIMRELGWRPQYGKLEDILESAWRWHSEHPEGYAFTL